MQTFCCNSEIHFIVTLLPFNINIIVRVSRTFQGYLKSISEAQSHTSTLLFFLNFQTMISFYSNATQGIELALHTPFNARNKKKEPKMGFAEFLIQVNCAVTMPVKGLKLTI